MDNERFTVKRSSYTNWGTMITGEDAKKMISAQNEWDKIAPKHMIDQIDKDAQNYIKVLVDYKGNDNFPDMECVVSVDSLIKSSINLLTIAEKNINNNHEIMDLYCSPTLSYSTPYIEIGL